VKRTLLVGAVLVALTVGLAFLIRIRADGPVSVASSSAEIAVPTHRAEIEQPLLSDAVHRRRGGDSPGDTGTAPSIDASSDEVNASPELLLIRVVDDATGAPMPEAEVTLRAGGQRPFIMFADEHGEFEFATHEIPAQLGDKVGVAVKDSNGRTRLRTALVIAPGIVLRVPPALILRGEIVLTSGSSPAGLSVSAWTPPAGIHGVERFVADQQLAEDGRFEISAGLERAPATFTLRIGGVGVPASQRVPTAELTSISGARVVVGLAMLRIVVQEDDSTPIPRAVVRCAAIGSTDGQAEIFAEASTGEDGRAHMWVPAGTISVVAGSPDHARARSSVRVEAGAVEVVLRLRRLTAADRLHGSVVFDDDSPVAGALVSAWCAADAGNLSVTATKQQRTDERGQFELAMAVDEDLLVFAIHQSYGDTNEQPWKPGDGPVRLVIDRGITLHVVAHDLPARNVLQANEVLVVLVRDDGRVDVIGTDSFPVEFDRVPPGRWRAFAIANGAQRSATADIVVERERPAELALRFVPLEFVEGRVSPPPDTERRMSVAFTPPGWPIEAVEALLTHELGVDGTFRVAAPTPGDLSLREGSKTIERRPARGGTPLIFTLPD